MNYCWNHSLSSRDITYFIEITSKSNNRAKYKAIVVKAIAVKAIVVKATVVKATVVKATYYKYKINRLPEIYILYSN